MSAKWTKPRNTTSSLSNRENTRRKPFKRRNNRSTSLRRLHIFRSYSPKVERQLTCLAALIRFVHQQKQRLVNRSEALQQCTSHRGITRLPSGQRKRYGCSSIRGNHMNLGGPAASGFSDGLGAVFFNAPVPSGWTLTTVLSSETASILMRTICSRCSSAIHPRIDRVPVAETFRQPTPFAAMLCNVKDRVQHISVRHAYVAALLWQAMFDSLKLGFGGFHLRGIRSNN